MLKLPPLSALRAFEAVSRLGSVTQAAQELHVTHSAVSHQLKLLETYLGVALIDRTARRVNLTSEGRVYASQVRLALQQVAGATERINMRTQAEHLTVAVLPSFGMHWLMPRLADFYAQHPHWRIELVASLEVVDFEVSPADCAIRFGAIKAQDVHSERLMSEWQLLVAAHNDARFSPTQSPYDAAHAGQLIATNEDWNSWCVAAGLEVAQPQQSLIVNDSNLALEAARSGLGMVLTRLSIADLWLKQGWLQKVTPVVAPHPWDYHLVWPNRSHQSDKVQIFAAWLKAQCQLFEQGVFEPVPTDGRFGFLHAPKLKLPLRRE
ncbi:MAG: LysR substrate-binding domain-containing protein [Formosimonas sp.]